jgi:hypothetical protein
MPNEPNYDFDWNQICRAPRRAKANRLMTLGKRHAGLPRIVSGIRSRSVLRGFRRCRRCEMSSLTKIPRRFRARRALRHQARHQRPEGAFRAMAFREWRSSTIPTPRSGLMTRLRSHFRLVA